MKLINELLLTKDELISLDTFLKMNEKITQELLDKFCRNRSFVVILKNDVLTIYKN